MFAYMNSYTSCVNRGPRDQKRKSVSQALKQQVGEGCYVNAETMASVEVVNELHY